ncbi:unnamed protein product, partial [marine sediment metagenome]
MNKKNYKLFIDWEFFDRINDLLIKERQGTSWNFQKAL